MEKLKFNNTYEVNKEALFEELKDAIYSNKELLEIIESNKIDDEFIKKNIVIFKQILFAGNCKDCDSLDTCVMSPKGFVKKLVISNNIASTKLFPCEKKEIEIKNIQNQEKVLVSYLEGKEALLNFNDLKKVEKLNKDLVGFVKKVSEILNNNQLICEKIGSNIFFYGPSTKYKTYTFSAITNEIASRGKETIAYISMSKWSNEMVSSRVNGQNEKVKDLVSKLKQADIVIFDDLGSDIKNVFFRDSDFYQVIDFRSKFPHSKRSIYISNFTLDTLQNIYSTGYGKVGVVKQYETSQAKKIIDRISTNLKKVNLKN